LARRRTEKPEGIIMRHRSLTVAVTGVVVLLAALTSCADPDEPNAANTPALAASAGTRVVSDQEAAVPRMSPAAVVKALRKGPEKKRWAHLDMEVRTPQLTVTGKGDMSYARRNPEIALEMAGSCVCVSNVELLVSHGIYYISLPTMSEGDWARLDPMSPDSPLGPNFAKVSDDLDPLASLLAMRPGFRKVRYVGPDTLYGHAMAEYTLRVDLRAARAARGLAIATPPGARPWTYHLWFDRAGLVRQLTLKVPGLQLRSEMSQWGKRAHIRAPKPRDLVGVDPI
jgi:hypothetical protein